MYLSEDTEGLICVLSALAFYAILIFRVYFIIRGARNNRPQSCVFSPEIRARLFKLLGIFSTAATVAQSDIIREHGSDAVDFLQRWYEKEIETTRKKPDNPGKCQCQLLERLERNSKLLEDIRQYKESRSNDGAKGASQEK